MTEYNVHRVRFIEHKPKAINSAAFGLHNGKLNVALSREDGSIEIRDPNNDWMLNEVIPGQDGRTVEHLVWCDGRLFSGGLNGEIIEWNLELMQPKYTQDSYGGPVWCIHFSNSKQYVAAGCEDGSVRLFEVLRDSIMYEKCLHKQEHRILSFSWSPCDQFLVTGGFDCTMRMYNVKTGQIISRMTVDNLKDGNTVIWSIEFLSNMTMVMGDSLGNTQFWDCHTGTLLQSFHSHQADVLVVSVSKDKQVVYSTGIDSKVTQFSLVHVEDEAKWIQTKSVRATNHDTRALAICPEQGNFMISGGVDPRFVVYDLNDFSSQTFIRFACLPPVDAVQLSVSANVLLYREEKKLHVWKLKDIKDPTSKPKKLFELKSDHKDHLLCSAISDSGKFLAHSSVSRCCLLVLTYQPKPSLKKISSLKLSVASKLAFTHQETTLIGAGFKNCLNLVNLESMEKKEILFPDTIQLTLPFCHLEISDDDKFICVVDVDSRCFLFSLVDQSYVMQLPGVGSKISTVKFHPQTGNVFLVTCKKLVYEFDIESEKFLPWSFKLNNSKTLSAMGRMKNKIDILSFNPLCVDEIFFQTKEVLGKITYGCDIPSTTSESKKKRKQTVLKEHGLFNNVMFFGFNKKGEMVVVERPMSAILQALPQPLKIKKFGS